MIDLRAKFEDSTSIRSEKKEEEKEEEEEKRAQCNQPSTKT